MFFLNCYSHDIVLYVIKTVNGFNGGAGFEPKKCDFTLWVIWGGGDQLGLKQIVWIWIPYHMQPLLNAKYYTDFNLLYIKTFGSDSNSAPSMSNRPCICT